MSALTTRQVIPMRGGRILRLAGAALTACVLLPFYGCNDKEEFESLKYFPPLNVPFFDISGHWLGQTGNGREFTMDLNCAHSQVTGQMTRAAMSGVFQGEIDEHNAQLSFTVTWPDASATTGSADVFDEGRMKDGSLTEAEGTDTFSARRQ